MDNGIFDTYVPLAFDLSAGGNLIAYLHWPFCDQPANPLFIETAESAKCMYSVKVCVLVCVYVYVCVYDFRKSPPPQYIGILSANWW